MIPKTNIIEITNKSGNKNNFEFRFFTGVLIEKGLINGCETPVFIGVLILCNGGGEIKPIFLDEIIKFPASNKAIYKSSAD